MSEEKRSFRVAGKLWVWVPCLLPLAVAVAVFVLRINRPVFFHINSWPALTGDNYWALLTILSDGVVSFAILLPWIRRRPENVWAILVAAIAFTIISQFTKHAVNMPRPPKLLPPDQIHVIGPAYQGHTFPSGHAAMVFSMAGVWALTTRQVPVRLALVAFASLVALSRVAVGVHWPLDILVGASMGWILAALGVHAAERFPWGYGLRAQRLMGGAMLLCAIVLFFPYCGFNSILWEQRTLAMILFLVGAYEYAALYEEGGRVRAKE